MKRVFALFTCLTWAVTGVLFAADAKKPNILFIVGDDMGYADEGFQGCQDIPTPHLDGHYVIFGQCDAAAVRVAHEASRQPRDERNDRPHEPVKIVSITIQR